jgi:hypothetical protein
VGVSAVVASAFGAALAGVREAMKNGTTATSTCSYRPTAFAMLRLVRSWSRR